MIVDLDDVGKCLNLELDKTRGRIEWFELNFQKHSAGKKKNFSKHFK